MRITNLTLHERAHRIGRRKGVNGIQESKPRTIVFKMYDWKEEYLIKRAKKVKRPGLFINEDLAKETIRRRKELTHRLIEARKPGKLAYFNLDKLIVRDRPRKY